MLYSSVQPGIPEPTLLIVDDEPYVHAALKHLLQNEGYRILAAENAFQALELLKSERIDVILADYLMPEMSGTEFLARVKQQQHEAVCLILSGQPELDEITQAMNNGNIYKFLTKPWNDELLRANIREAFRQADYIHTTETRISHLQSHDVLTDMLNRDSIEKEFNELKQEEKDLYLLIVGLDRFHNINASYGHHIGDQILIEVARRISEQCWLQVKGRLGSDEFGILVTAREESQIQTLANEILTLLRTPFKTRKQDLLLTASIGICHQSSADLSFDQLLGMATMALSYAKAKGGNNYRFYDHPMKEAADRQSQIENLLRGADYDTEFFLNYQPQISLATGEMTGVETLLRWNQTQFGLIPPNEFIPVAEKTDLMQTIGEWVLNKACNQACAWEALTSRQFTIAVNVSPLQITNREFPQLMKEIFANSGIAPGCIEIEITESSLLQEMEITKKNLYALKDMGILLALDDFGTGYSCMSYLNQLPFDKLKIDQSFVRGINSESKLSAITSSIVNMSHKMNMKVVAEGVETREELEFLRACQCDVIQGYFFSPPVGADEIRTLLDNPFSIEEQRDAG